MSETEVQKPSRAPAKKTAPAFVRYVSREHEPAAFPLVLGGVTVKGVWDNERKHVHWKVPAEFADAADMHHHVRMGRIVRAKG